MFFRKKQIDSLSVKMPREELVRRSRILIIDDERPDLMDDLKAAHFSVDHETDIVAEKIDLIEKSLYDLVLLDFGDVGAAFGQDQGLSLLKHIKRVNPAIVILSYTSKALETRHADFYRQTDGVLAKDAGIQESLEKIEDALRKAHSIKNLWAGLLSLCDVVPGSPENLAWQDLFVRGRTSQRKLAALQSKVATVLTSETTKTVGIALLTKAAELAAMAAMGGLK
ncbi:MAG: response regulator [Thermoguttaceae bacterium]